MTFKMLAITTSLLFTTAAVAEHHETMERPFFKTSQTQIISATVKAIDHETREVTVEKSDGETVTFTASEQARNLGQVEAGDVIQAEYVQSLMIEVVANDGMEPEAAQALVVARSEEGEMPGLAAMDSTVVTAIVEDINIEANTFKLRGPRGNVQEYVARNPENLKRAKLGDLVVITVTEAVAIAVSEKDDS